MLEFYEGSCSKLNVDVLEPQPAVADYRPGMDEGGQGRTIGWLKGSEDAEGNKSRDEKGDEKSDFEGIKENGEVLLPHDVRSNYKDTLLYSKKESDLGKVEDHFEEGKIYRCSDAILTSREDLERSDKKSNKSNHSAIKFEQEKSQRCKILKEENRASLLGEENINPQLRNEVELSHLNPEPKLVSKISNLSLDSKIC